MPGDSFAISGEVLLPSFSVHGAGDDRTVVADRWIQEEIGPFHSRFG
jgi:hypothetical protein